MKNLSLGDETLVLDVEHCQDRTCELHLYLVGHFLIERRVATYSRTTVKSISN